MASFVTRAGEALGKFADKHGDKIIDFVTKEHHPLNAIKNAVEITSTPKEFAEKVVAAPIGMARSVGENTFRIKDNPDSLLGFDIDITKKAKVVAAGAIVGSTAFDLATMNTNNIGPTENGIKTATPTLDEYLDPTYAQTPSYANANADGDLVLALNRNRNG